MNEWINNLINANFVKAHSSQTVRKLGYLRGTKDESRIMLEKGLGKSGFLSSLRYFNNKVDGRRVCRRELVV